jgi:hypothetical protein
LPDGGTATINHKTERRHKEKVMNIATNSTPILGLALLAAAICILYMLYRIKTLTKDKQNLTMEKQEQGEQLSLLRKRNKERESVSACVITIPFDLVGEEKPAATTDWMTQFAVRIRALFDQSKSSGATLSVRVTFPEWIWRGELPAFCAAFESVRLHTSFGSQYPYWVLEEVRDFAPEEETPAALDSATAERLKYEDMVAVTGGVVSHE